MYNYISGKLVQKAKNLAVVDCGGIGYEIHISQTTLSLLPEINSDVKIYTYLIVKEDDMSLCGFSSLDEKDMFLKLISVSGIGSKTALNILSNTNYKDLLTAIQTADIEFISNIKSIGKKTSQRIVVELRDKVSTGEDLGISSNVKNEENSKFNLAKLDAIDALVSLGIQKTEATKIVAKVAESNDTPETIVSNALKQR